MRITMATAGLLLSLGCLGADLHNLDQAFHSSFKRQAEAIAKAHLPKDQSGLIGRNRKWGAMYSPRFQLGSGFALRVSLYGQQKVAVQQAYRGIEVATNAIDPSGQVNSTLPTHIALGRSVSDADSASAAAFFLGDACLGIHALISAPPSTFDISMQRVATVSTSLSNATHWLSQQLQLLKNADAHAPNRLLFNARAFAACAQLEVDKAERTQLIQLAYEFTQLAMQMLSKQGYFIEGGGFDTSYQSVAIVLGEELIAIDPLMSMSLSQGITLASTWLAQRIDQYGRLNSAGNARTCQGGEHFLGRQKQVALVEVFKALSFTGLRTQNQQMLSKATLLANWIESQSHKPTFTPCYEPE